MCVRHRPTLDFQVLNGQTALVIAAARDDYLDRDRVIGQCEDELSRGRGRGYRSANLARIFTETVDGTIMLQGMKQTMIQNMQNTDMNIVEKQECQRQCQPRDIPKGITYKKIPENGYHDHTQL
jgi:hypothetical protein